MKSNVVEDRLVVSTVGELNFEQLRNKFSLKAARLENFIQGSPKIKSRAFSYWIFMYRPPAGFFFTIESLIKYCDENNAVGTIDAK